MLLSIISISGCSMKNAGLSSACNNGDSDKCIKLATSYYIDGKDKESIELYKKACDMGNADGCMSLGKIYADGFIVKQNYKKAKQLYKKSCTLGNDDSCLLVKNFHLIYSKPVISIYK